MNYAKIQEILEHDSKFGPLVANRDTTVPTRNGEVVYAALTAQVADAIENRGMGDKACNRNVVLAFAEMLTKRGSVQPVPSVAPQPKQEVAQAIVVRPAPTADVKPSAEKAQQKAQQADLSHFVARGDILKFQAAVAIGQLLAAVYQLAESDCWDGHERRKELLVELLDSYEQVSKRHVNYSVRQIIRAKAEEQFNTGS